MNIDWALHIGTSDIISLDEENAIDDPLGGKLTTEQMILRDRMVFSFAKDNAIPLAWNLAGGYQDPIDNVIDLHENTLKECLSVYKLRG